MAEVEDVWDYLQTLSHAALFQFVFVRDFVYYKICIFCVNWHVCQPWWQKYTFLPAIEWTVVDGWHITGHTIHPVVQVTSAEACQQLCLAATMCKAISYIHDTICHLHNVTRLQAGVHWVAKQNTKYSEFYLTPLGMIGHQNIRFLKKCFTVRLVVIDLVNVSMPTTLSLSVQVRRLVPLSNSRMWIFMTISPVLFYFLLFHRLSRITWASYQIYKIGSCTCAGNAGNVFPATDLRGNR